MPFPEKSVLRLVAYYRADPSSREVSAVSLDRQRTAVNAYGWFRRSEIVAEHTELEDGGTRSQLALAILTAHRMDADLLIAGIGFLIENASFLIQLDQAEKTYGVRTFACGFGDGDPLPVKILLDAAKFTTRSHAELTKVGLEAAKARGVKLGTTGPAHAGIALLARVAKATKLRSRHLTVIREVQRANPSLTTYQAVADALNARGVTAPRGGQWSPAQVRRVMKPAVGGSRTGASNATETPIPSLDLERAGNRALH